ncbi:MAG: pre-peptidase C-terminal domain-containing protein [Algicola sp.]|nr:pre-peptidase C-terminal domain-containing protein [Algicola sp.]
MKNLKKALQLTLAATAVMLALPSAADHVWGTGSSASSAYHWDTTELSVIDSVSGEWQGHMEESNGWWNTGADTGVSSPLNLTVTAVDDGSSARSSCSISTGNIRVCNASYGTNGWLGLASLNIDSGNHILWGTAKLNESYSMTTNEKRGVMCQEVGHLFGLGHTSENGSSQDTCMDYSSSPDDGIDPNAHDFELLNEIYSHVGGGGTTPPDSSTCDGDNGDLCNGDAVSGLSGKRRNEQDFHMHVPSGSTNVTFSISGGSGDADMYVKLGSQAQTNNYDCRPYLTGNNETCNMSGTGDYHVMIRAYSTYSGVTLNAGFTAANGFVADQSTYGQMVKSNHKNQIWVKHNANGSRTLTHIRLIGDSNKVVKNGKKNNKR